MFHKKIMMLITSVVNEQLTQLWRQAKDSICKTNIDVTYK